MQRSFIDNCILISSDGEGHNKDTAKVVLAKKMGRELMKNEAEPQLDRLDSMSPMSEAKQKRVAHWLEKAMRKLNSSHMKTCIKGYKCKMDGCTCRRR